MKHLTRPNACAERVWMRFINASKRVRCFSAFSDAFGCVQIVAAFKRIRKCDETSDASERVEKSNAFRCIWMYDETSVASKRDQTTNATKRVPEINACKRDTKINASKRVWSIFWEKNILFSQICAAAPSESRDGQLFPRGIFQNKWTYLDDNYDMCGDWD
jgi:hypothetical protein